MKFICKNVCDIDWDSTSCLPWQGVPKVRENAPFLKRSQNSSQTKKWRHFFIKAQFESQEHLHQTTFETLKYNKPCFETAYSHKIKKKCLCKKVAQNVDISLRCFIISKKSQRASKSSQIGPIWTPCAVSTLKASLHWRHLLAKHQCQQHVTAFALATLGGTTEIGSFLFCTRCPGKI